MGRVTYPTRSWATFQEKHLLWSVASLSHNVWQIKKTACNANETEACRILLTMKTAQKFLGVLYIPSWAMNILWALPCLLYLSYELYQTTPMTRSHFRNTLLQRCQPRSLLGYTVATMWTGSLCHSAATIPSNHMIEKILCPLGGVVVSVLATGH
jgi:hypothetical protein